MQNAVKVVFDFSIFQLLLLLFILLWINRTKFEMSVLEKRDRAEDWYGHVLTFTFGLTRQL